MLHVPPWSQWGTTDKVLVIAAGIYLAAFLFTLVAICFHLWQQDRIDRMLAGSDPKPYDWEIEGDWFDFYDAEAIRRFNRALAADIAKLEGAPLVHRFHEDRDVWDHLYGDLHEVKAEVGEWGPALPFPRRHLHVVIEQPGDAA
jgi:hypothetical protein